MAGSGRVVSITMVMEVLAIAEETVASEHPGNMHQDRHVLVVGLDTTVLLVIAFFVILSCCLSTAS
jgi:hypothetical protein